MNTRRERRARGEATGNRQLNVSLPPDCMRKLNFVADRVGISLGRTVEEFVRHLVIDEYRQPEVDAETADGRRARGSAQGNRQLNISIPQDCKAKLDHAKIGLGISLGRTVELVVRHTMVDATGRPEFYDGPMAVDRAVDEEVWPLFETA